MSSTAGNALSINAGEKCSSSLVWFLYSSSSWGVDLLHIVRLGAWVNSNDTGITSSSTWGISVVGHFPQMGEFILILPLLKFNLSHKVLHFQPILLT